MNVKDLIKKFGGQSALAGQLGIGQSAVAYWVSKNLIPSKWHQQLLSIAQSKGLDIGAADLLAVDALNATDRTVSAPAQAFAAPLLPSALASGAEQFLFYASDKGTVKVQVFVQNETVWATQAAIADIFDTSRENISTHLKNIFEINELSEESVCKNNLHTAADGKNYPTNFYNLDAIISVGYRVNSYKATQFRRWATTVLKEYMIKGFALDDDRLKQGSKLFGQDYFDELLVRIREIRASERRFYQRVTDIFRECSIDYDPESETTKLFYAHVQDKLHFAVSGHTSAELKLERANASKPNMGLTSYKNEKTGGKITKLDVTVGKNYLSEREMDDLNRLVSMYLDWAENFAKRSIPMTMKDWAEKLNGFLSFNAYQILEGFGKVRADTANHHAEAEYAKFRVRQDREYRSDFDRVVSEIKAKNRLPKLE